MLDLTDSEYINYDLHTHTRFSFDSESEPRDIAEAAIALGLKGIAFTDHMEIDEYKKNPGLFRSELTDLHKAAAVLPALAEEYAGRLDIVFGLELGNADTDFALAEEWINTYDYKFILGSIHGLKNDIGFYFVDFNTVEPYGLLEKYFKQVLDIAKWKKRIPADGKCVSSLAHLTYPLRYIIAKTGAEIDLTKFDGVITEIFKTIIENGTALEINGAGLINPGYERTDPPPPLIEKYKSMGGSLFTYGSDSHDIDKMKKTWGIFEDKK